MVTLLTIFGCGIATAENSLPKPWIQINQEDYVAGISMDDCYEGNYCAFLKSIDDSAVSVGELLQVIKPPKDWLGKKIKLKAYLKAVEVEGSSGLFLKVVNSSGGYGYDYMTNRTLRGTLDWNEYLIILDIPTDALKIDFGMWLKGAGEIKVDHFSFELARPGEQTTGKISQNKRDGKPTNLGFEGY